MLLKFLGGEVRTNLATQYDVEHVDYVKNKVKGSKTRTFSEIVPRLSYKEMEATYRNSGVIRRGINKKARDAVRKGFQIVLDEEDQDATAEANRQMRAWMRLTMFKARTQSALRDMFIFGDGFLELGFDDTNPTSAAPPASAEILAVYKVDPLSILPVKDPDTGEIMAYLQGDNIRDKVNRTRVRKWSEGKAPLPRGVTEIHPDRLVHFQVNTIRDPIDCLGLSVIEAAYVNALAKLAGDVSAGDVLEWYSKGFFVVKIEGSNVEEQRAAKEQLDAAKAARKNYFVGSERHDFDIKSPLIANVKPFYDNFYVEFAGALEMPVMVLIGVQKGTVTGSETDLVEYYEDIASLQELLLEAPFLLVAQRVLGRDDFSFEWVKLYVDAQAEADLRFKNSQATAILFNGGVLSRRQAIQYLKDGSLPNQDDVPDGYTESGQFVGPDPEESGAAVAAPPVAQGDDDDDSFSDI